MFYSGKFFSFAEMVYKIKHFETSWKNTFYFILLTNEITRSAFFDRKRQRSLSLQHTT